MLPAESGANTLIGSLFREILKRRHKSACNVFLCPHHHLADSVLSESRDAAGCGNKLLVVFWFTCTNILLVSETDKWLFKTSGVTSLMFYPGISTLMTSM